MPPLILVENDKERQLVEKTGLYALEIEMLKSPQHARKAIEEAKTLFIEGVRKVLGYEHYPRFGKDGFKYEGPLPHTEVAHDLSDDLGPIDMPPPPVALGGEISEQRMRNWQDAMDTWTRAENARAARKTNGSSGLVDFRLYAKFLTAGLPFFRRAGDSTGEPVGGKTGILIARK